MGKLKTGSCTLTIHLYINKINMNCRKMSNTMFSSPKYDIILPAQKQ